MTQIEEKIALHQQRQYLADHYGALVVAAGYENETFAAEDALLLFVPIKNRVEKLVGRLLLDYDELLAVTEALTDEEKTALRETIKFTPLPNRLPAFKPTLNK
jgi:hypothetical protein